jgi:hypothetical protein
MAPVPSKRFAKRTSVECTDEQKELETRATDQDVDFSSELCPDTLSVCPVAPAGSLTSKPKSVQELNSIGFECVDFKTDLGFCGGCSAYKAR